MSDRELSNGLDRLWNTGVFESNVLAILHGARRESWECELAAGHDEFTKFWQCNPLGWIRFKYPAEYTVELVRDGKNRAKERSVPHEGPERRVVVTCALPWVSSAGEVHQNHTEGPHIIGC
jgi:hypothetical protein